MTGGFHGVEEFVTVLQFLWLKVVEDEGDSPEMSPEKTTKRLGELVRRFGDSYAHTKFDNIKPIDIKSYKLQENSSNESIAINS